MEKIVNKCKVGGGAFQSTLNVSLLNKNFYQTSRLGFTLAEMMVVMLILSIIMAAMAPVMTTRNKLDQSAPWSWATNGSDAYYGLGDAQVAMIGQEEVKPTDDGARFIINSPSSLNHILFKNGDTTNGRLNMSNSNVFLGSTATGQTIGSYSTGLGRNIGPSGISSVSVGYNSSANGRSSVSVGHANKSTVDYTLASGYSNTVSGLYSIGLGIGNTVSGQDSIVLGRSNTVNGQDSIILGRNNEVNSNNSIGIGTNISPGQSGIAIGNSSGAASDTEGAIAIGNGAKGTSDYSIALGSNAKASNTGFHIASIAIGRNALSTGNISIAIGSADNSTSSDYYTASTGFQSIAIGANAKASSFGGISIGSNACLYSKGQANVTCIGDNSGPSIGDTKLINQSHIMFLGKESTTVYIPGNLVVSGNVLLNGRTGTTTLIRDANSQNGLYEFQARNSTNENDNLRLYPYFLNRPNNISMKSFFENYLNSDRRLKYVGSESTSGLDKIRQLKVFNYTFKKDKKKVPHVGVIAQDLQKVFPNAVKKGVDGFLTIRMEDMFYAMINAIKELDSKISTLEKENKELKAALKQLQENNKKQEARLKALEAKIK